MKCILQDLSLLFFSEIWNLVPYYETVVQRRKALEESTEKEVRDLWIVVLILDLARVPKAWSTQTNFLGQVFCDKDIWSCI